MILTKKYHYSFPAEFFNDYRRSFNKGRSQVGGNQIHYSPPTEKKYSDLGKSYKEYFNLGRIIKEEDYNITDDIGGKWYYPKGICNKQVDRATNEG